MLSYSFLNTELYFDTNSQSEFVHFFHLFSNFYPIFNNHMSVVSKDTLSIVNPTKTGPVYFKESQVIFLAVEPSVWNDTQFVYQASHELCHYFIESDKSLIMKWFEETICEVSSLFFLNKMSEYHQSIGDLQNSLRYKSYLTTCISEVEPFNINSNITLERYDRKKERYLATLLLPIFEKHPLLWREIPSLINSNPKNFVELLINFEKMVPIYLDEAKREFTDLFPN
ncbi:hypothetical protein ACI3E5_06205 [Candidatus Enterococcus avicola]